MTTHLNSSSAVVSPMSPQERRTAKRLVASMHRHQIAARESALELIDLYAAHRLDADARAVALMLITAHVEPGARAVECLGMGLRMEAARRFDLAAWAYTLGVAYEPTDTDDWYWLNNNLGFSLNQIGCHLAAEPHCRAAIRCDPGLYNAHKNLGVALEGQERVAEAARSYVTAVRSEPGDRRALCHLATLVQAHRFEIAQHVPEALAVLAEHRQQPATEQPRPPAAHEDTPESHENVNDQNGEHS